MDTPNYKRSVKYSPRAAPKERNQGQVISSICHIHPGFKRKIHQKEISLKLVFLLSQNQTFFGYLRLNAQ